MSLEDQIPAEFAPFIEACSMGDNNGLVLDDLAAARAKNDADAKLFVEAEREASKGLLNERWQTITGRNGNAIELLILEPVKRQAKGPVMVWAHGGGYVLGDANCGLARSLSRETGCTFISVEYRLGPEHPAPAAAEDMCDALLWVRDHAAELDIDSDRIAVGGISGGGGLAAGTALMNRDQQGVALNFQFLIFPMLDNLHNTPSGQLDGHAIWNRQASLAAWEMYLGGTPGEQASPYGAAARAKDVSGLPPTHISVGQSDLFRDECIDYAKRLMATGVPTQLDVFPHHIHGSELAMPELSFSKRMTEARMQALKDGLAANF